MPFRAGRRPGLTLVEMVVSIMLVGIMLVAALGTVGATQKTRYLAAEQRRAHTLARSLLSEILAQKYADPEDLAAIRVLVLGQGLTASLSTGLDIAESTGTRAAFDDVDDYHAWSASPPESKDGTKLGDLTGWTRSVQVVYVPHDDLTATSSQDDGLKRITVTVQHDGITRAELVGLRALRVPATEACCLPDGSCLDMTRAVCTSHGGTPGGPNTSCLQTSCQPQRQNSLVAHWDFEENGGSTASDGTGGHEATLFNGVAWSSGAIGRAVSFDGNNDYGVIPHSDDFLLDEGTYAMWFGLNQVEHRVALISKDSTNYDTGGHLTIMFESGVLRVRFQSTTTDYYVNSGSISRNRWYHVAFTFGPRGMQLYLDGVLIDTDPYTGGMGTTSGGTGNHEPLVIGANAWASGDLQATPISYYTDGRLDELRIYDKQLTSDEVLDAMAGN